jgi:ribosomal protein uS19
VVFCSAQAEAPKRRTFRKFTFRGIDLEKLMDLDSTQIMDLMHSRVRRRFARGLKRKPLGLIKRLRKEKTKVNPGEKPDTVKTHLRDMIIVPEMIGSQIGIYNGKVFNTVEIKVCGPPSLYRGVRTSPSPQINALKYLTAGGVYTAAGDGWPLPRRILYHLQARLSRSCWYWCHQVVSLRAAQVMLWVIQLWKGNKKNIRACGAARGDGDAVREHYGGVSVWTRRRQQR